MDNTYTHKASSSSFQQQQLSLTPVKRKNEGKMAHHYSYQVHGQGAYSSPQAQQNLRVKLRRKGAFFFSGRQVKIT